MFQWYICFQNEHERVRPLGCVVSLGTGRVPVVPRDHIDMFVPTGIVEGYKVVKGFTAFMQMLVDQVGMNLVAIQHFNLFVPRSRIIIYNMLNALMIVHKVILSYDVASESVIKPCIKNNPLVD